MPAKRYVCTNCRAVRRRAGSCAKCGGLTSLVEVPHTAFRAAYLVPEILGLVALALGGLVSLADGGPGIFFGFWAAIGWMVIAFPFSVVYDRRLDEQARTIAAFMAGSPSPPGPAPPNLGDSQVMVPRAPIDEEREANRAAR